MNPTQPCELCNHDHTHTTRLCATCQHNLHHHLTTAPTLMLTLAQQGIDYEHIDKHATGYITFTPADVNIISMLDSRSGITRVLTDWATLIREELNLTKETKTLKLQQLTNLHTKWLPWTTTSFDMVADYTAEIRGEWRKLDNAVNGKPKNITIGRCPTTLEDTKPCGATLSANPDTDTITCPTCQTQWTADKNWKLLGKTVNA
jgi:hypothetical protein